MKRPDKEIDNLNGTLHRPVVEYIAHLEGWIAAIKENLIRVTGSTQRKKGIPKTEFTGLCASCIFSKQVPAPSESDKKTLIVCDEPLSGRGESLIQQCRQLGACGPSAVLRQEKSPEAEGSP